MSRIRLYPSSRLVDCEPGDTVLEALERAGYALPNNCRAGACGECKVRIRDGEIDQGFVLDMALAPEERDAGYGLMCMAKPLSDELEIEWGSADARPVLFPPRNQVPFVLVDRITRTPRISEFVLRPVAEAVRYWPGQYVRIGDAALEVPQRSYSMATPPGDHGELRLHVTRMDGGRTSAWLHGLRTGETVLVSGAYGTFVGDPTAQRPVVCLAAGSGLAPILALTEAALRRGFAEPVTLVFSARTEADRYDEGLLAYWAIRYPNFRWVTTLTRERIPGRQHGRIGRVLPEIVPSLVGHGVYIAGDPAFVEAAVTAARELGADAALIHTEGFHGQADADAVVPTGFDA